MGKLLVTKRQPIFDEAVVIIPTAAWHSDEDRARLAELIQRDD